MSSSAPADPPTTGRQAAAPAGALAALVGSVFFKLATAAGLAAGGASLLAVCSRSAGGFAVDGLLLFALLIVGVWLPRMAFAAGTLMGILGAVDVFFALRLGAPLTPSQLAWTSSVSLTQAGWPAIATVVAVAFVLLIAARRRPAEPHLIGTIAVLLVLVGALGWLIDDDEQRRNMGLDASPTLSLVQRPSSPPPPAETIAFDAHIADPDPAWSAAVDVAVTRAPNHVVVFLSESTATRFVDAQTMPQLTALKSEHSLTFSEHTAQSPISIKAIFSLLCGLHPDPTPALETTSLPRIGCDSLPEVLTAKGFDAALFHGGYFAFTDKLAFLSERGFQRLVDGESLPQREEQWHNGWGVDDRAVVDAALSWFDARPDPAAPSFLVVVPLIPHHEYFLPPDAPRPFGDRNLMDRYKNGLHFADDVFGQLVSGYRARGVFDDTLFVFVGDHGEAFDEHPRNRLHGSFLYEENVRAPLVLISTRLFPSAQTSARPSSHADILPTILDLLGLPPPFHSQGQSLVSSSYVPRLVPLFTAVPTLKVGVRTPHFKLVHDEHSASDELYDLLADPHELQNLALQRPDVATQLRTQALSFLADQPRRLRALPLKEEAPWLKRAADDAGLELSDERVFNMVRRCVPLTTSTTTDTVLHFPHLNPPARSVGVGVLDQSRAAHHGPITIDIAETPAQPESESTTIAVDDDFMSSSRVIELDPPCSSLSVRVHPSPTGAAGCLWLAP